MHKVQTKCIITHRLQLKTIKMVSKCEYYVSYVRIGVNIEIDSIKKVSMPCTKHLLVIMNIIINIKNPE